MHADVVENGVRNAENAFSGISQQSYGMQNLFERSHVKQMKDLFKNS